MTAKEGEIGAESRIWNKGTGKMIFLVTILAYTH